MRECSLIAEPLGNIVTYGGDTQPWEISFTHSDGSPYVMDELGDASCTLEYLPFCQSVYLEDADIDTPILTKEGYITNDANGHVVAQFSFLPSDTMYLRGKYIYQISISRGDIVLRVRQGRITYLPNVNRGAV